MPDGDVLSSLDALAAIVPADLLLYVVDTSEALLADKSKKLAYTLFETYTDARYLQDAPSNGSQYARQNGAWAVVTGGVASVFGRTGAVVAVSGDYSAALITNTPAGGIAAVTVQAAIDELDAEKAAIASLDNVAFSGAYADLSGTPTLGTIAALNSPLPIANGGTAATTDSGARTNLGLVIGTNVQAWDADLDTLAGLAKADGNFIVGDGAFWVVESGATVRTSLGLGTIATQNANNVTISGGSITGITDLAIADGGTGQSTAQLAINALTAVSGATNEHVLTKDTATGNAIFKAAAGGSSLPVADTQTIVMGSADNTKLLRFEVDGFTAGATRVLTPPNANATIAGLEVANVFTVGQTIGAATALTLSTANSKITGSTGVTIEETGDEFGTFNLSVKNRSGIAGVTLAQQSAHATVKNLCDFLLTVNASTMLMRYDHTAATARLSWEISTGGRLEWSQTTLTLDQRTTTASGIHTAQNFRVAPLSGSPSGGGYGIRLVYSLRSSTTSGVAASYYQAEWVDATHASFKSRTSISSWDSGGQREFIRGEGTGTAAAIGFLGAAAIPRPTTYTLASTATRTMPTPEAAFTGQDNAQAGSVYAKSADLITLQTRLNSVEGVLRQLIIDLASTSGYGLLVAS